MNGYGNSGEISEAIAALPMSTKCLAVHQHRYKFNFHSASCGNTNTNTCLRTVYTKIFGLLSENMNGNEHADQFR